MQWLLKSCYLKLCVHREDSYVEKRRHGGRMGQMSKQQGECIKTFQLLGLHKCKFFSISVHFWCIARYTLILALHCPEKLFQYIFLFISTLSWSSCITPITHRLEMQGKRINWECLATLASINLSRF